MRLVTPFYFFIGTLLSGIIKTTVSPYFKNYYTELIPTILLVLLLIFCFRFIDKNRIGQVKVNKITGILLWLSSIFLTFFSVMPLLD